MAFGLSLVLATAAPCGGADRVIVDDELVRSSRTSAPDSTGAQWFIIGPGTGATQANGTLTLANDGSAQFLAYFTPTASPVNLAIGEALTLRLEFSLVGTLGSNVDPTAFRIGMFRSGGTRIVSDITNLSSSSSFERYAGYALMRSIGTAGQSLRKRVELATANKNNLIGTANTVYGPALVSATSQGLTASVDYTAVLTALRTAAGLDFQVSISGGPLADTPIRWSDSGTDSINGFDTLAVGWSAGVLTAGGGVAVRRLLVTRSPPPHPPGTEDADRPFIWVRASERSTILSKISTQAWAANLRTALVNRNATHLSRHTSNRDAFLREIPALWDSVPARMKTMPTYPRSEVRDPAAAKLDAALDSAILYYLTGDERYARLAGDVLHNTVRTLLAVAPSASSSNGGWIIQNDFLLEARVLGNQLPLIYDFVRPFLGTNLVHDVQAGGPVTFDFAGAQEVFRTYFRLGRDRSQRESNWSALMSSSMLTNLLGLNDAEERAAALETFLTAGSARHSSLDRDYRNYPASGSLWPESLQYAAEVVEIRSSQLVLLERYDPTLNLLAHYPNYPGSLFRPSELRYPNGEQISFGDGSRAAEAEPFLAYELLYRQSRLRGLSALASSIGSRIARGIQTGSYNRAQLPGYSALGMHNEPLKLLLTESTIAEAAVAASLPRTDHVPFAGIALQRNPAPDGNPMNGLMCFVGGAGFVHSHASGMSMELYGAGQVLGAKSGRTTYGDAENENYYRVFASNNTVIVNGASRGSGDWNDLGIETVQLDAMEPLPGASAVSANHSFSTSSFLDNRGGGSEATQQRTLGIVRTSGTTGYYIDIFRSDSALEAEYHDYIYRNVGDSVSFESQGQPLGLSSAPMRFQNDIGDARKQPGWRYFMNTSVSAPTGNDVKARFSATQVSPQLNMTVHFPGVQGREFARVDSPPIVDAPAPYGTRVAPTLVVRHRGAAWEQPFVAVYEPHAGVSTGGSVQSVRALLSNGALTGVTVESLVGSRRIVQHILFHPTSAGSFSDPLLSLSFSGRYGVVTDWGDGTGSLYLGEGARLAFRGHSLAAPLNAITSAHVTFGGGGGPVVAGNATYNDPIESGRQLWRMLHFGTSVDGGDAADGADPDGDGWSNLQEHVLGMDPATADRGELLALARVAGGLAITFVARRAQGEGYEHVVRRYELQESTEPSGSAVWTSVPGYASIEGTDTTVRVTVTPTGTMRFYRLRAALVER